MEKESFVKIVDALAKLIRISDDFDKLVNNRVEFGIPQVEEIIEGLEIEFEDEEGWIRWYLLEALDDKELILQGKHYKIETSDDLYDFLDYSNANS